jgi:glutaredoxin
MEKKYTIIIILITIILLGGIVAFASWKNKSMPDYTALAQCVKEKGATFYGAFWCPHCQATKALFGKGAQSLPYTECSTADGKGQLQICTNAGVKQYPTWVFADGSRLTGEQSLEVLAAKTGCSINGVVPAPVSPSTPTASSSSAS